MRKIVALEFISLDGVIQAPGAPDEDNDGGFAFGGWTFPLSDDFTGEAMVSQMDMPLDLLLGRKTYDIFSNYWPHHTDVPVVGPAFDKAKKYVVSHNDIDLPWHESTLIKDNVVSELHALKQTDGPTLQVYGSSGLMQTLLKNDLVDELWLKIFPVTLGKGKRLFGEGTIPATFEVTDTKVSPRGVIFATYTRAGDVTTGSFA